MLVLHGGRSRSRAATRASQLAVLRMVPIARRAYAVGDGRLAVARLRYAVRGWNDEDASPMADVRWALDRLAERFSSVPIGLIGHSLGGRAALRSAGHPSVVSVVGLAPWLQSDEPVLQLAGRRVLLVHGTSDRTTSPLKTADLDSRLQDLGVDSQLVLIPGARHGMLSRPRVWHDLAAGFMARTLLVPGSGSRGSGPDLLERALTGAARGRGSR